MFLFTNSAFLNILNSLGDWSDPLVYSCLSVSHRGGFILWGQLPRGPSPPSLSPHTHRCTHIGTLEGEVQFFLTGFYLPMYLYLRVGRFFYSQEWGTLQMDWGSSHINLVVSMQFSGATRETSKYLKQKTVWWNVPIWCNALYNWFTCLATILLDPNS